ncbi:MAG: SwmB domain-containing protein [Syntrophomonadaceae bacterium]|jgi:uncharacterized repeat protein (TIGR02059 family)
MIRRCRLTIILILGLFMILTATAGSIAQPSDIHEHWAQKQITSWLQKGLASGYPDGSFKPDNSITRAEFITLTNRAFSFTEKADINYSDVEPDNWFAAEIARAQAAGYISGYDDGTMKPNQPISRQETAAIIARICKLDTSSHLNAVNKFKDAGTIPAWSKGSIGAVVAQGYMSGYPDQTYHPEKPISRAEAVVTLDNATKALVPGDGDTTYSKAGIYGPASNVDTVQGNVFISASDITLQNLKITGNLILGEGIGDGDATLRNVTVVGSTVIQGGGSHSIVFENCLVPNITVNKAGVRVVASGSTSINQVQLNSGATLVETSITAAGFKNVTLTQSIPTNTPVSLEGSFDDINVQTSKIQLNLNSGIVLNLQVMETAKDSSINIADNATVSMLTLNAPASVTGRGIIQTAQVNVSGSSFEQKPEKVVNPAGVSINFGTSNTSGGTTPGQTITVSGIELTNTFGAFKLSTSVVTTEEEILAKIKVNGVALKSVEKRNQGEDGKAWKAFIANPQSDTNYTITCESPFTISGTSVVRWSSVVSAPAVTNVEVADIGDTGTGSDLQVSFYRASGENQKIDSYRVMIVRASNAGSFNLNAANAVSAANYTVVDKAGLDTYTVTMDGARDTSGNSISNGIAYKVFVLSVADGTNAVVNGLSNASNQITLTTTHSGSGGGGKEPPAAPTFASAEVTSSGDLSITFSKPMEQTATLAGKKGQFDVRVDGAKNEVTALSLTGTPTKIKLTLTTKITSGQIVTVAYTKGDDAASRVVAADGGVLESFAAQAVSNELVPAAPVYVSSTVNGKGDISITFSKDMADPSGKEAQFSVKVDGKENIVTAVQSTGTANQIKLVLTNKITSGQTVTVSYTKGDDAASQIVAADGGVLESFAAQAVSNELVPAAPVYVSSTVNSKGDISITFSKDMADPSGKEAQFSVKVDGEEDIVTAVQSTGTANQIKLVLTNKVTSGQTVTVSYTKGDDAASQVVAADGGVLESFTDQTVANGLPPAAPVLIENGAQVTTKGDISLTFDKAIDVPDENSPQPDNMAAICAQFTVVVNGDNKTVTRVVATNTTGKIKLVVAEPKITGGDSVSITYTQGAAADQIKAIDGGILNNFGPLEIIK